MNENMKELIKELADLLDAELSYTINDDGIHLTAFNTEITFFGLDQLRSYLK